MKKLTLATIYRADDKNADDIAPSNTLESQNVDSPVDVLINDKPVDFLLDIIDNQCEFKILTDNLWVLRYFMGGPYEQILYVSFADCSANHPDITTYLTQQCDRAIAAFIDNPVKLVNAVFVETNSYQPSNEAIHYASYLVRSSASLAFDNLARHSDRFLHVDGRGAVLFSPNDAHSHTFKMQVILLGMAKAYILATSIIIRELGESCEDFTLSTRLYKQAVLFHAKSYFTNPVNVNRYDAYTFWQDIRKTMPIDDISKEIVQQVQSIHQLLTEEEDRLQYQNELKISTRLGWMGVGLAALSLVSIFEITPQKVGEFLSSWWGVFF